MPRATTKPSVMLMLSISMTARCLSVPEHFVREWIDEGRLVVKQVGMMKRIPVGGAGGIQALIESLPNAKVSHGQS